MSFENYVAIETISASDQNSNMPFLKNEFFTFFEVDLEVLLTVDILGSSRSYHGHVIYIP